MTAKDGAGQQAKKAADDKTESVAQANAAEQDQSGQDQSGQPTDATPARNDGAPEREYTNLEPNRAPFPGYDSLSLDDLKALADSRQVEMNRDVEKSELIKELRANDDSTRGTDEVAKGAAGQDDNAYATYDVVPLEKLRELAKSRDVKLSDEFVRAHLITELRAADTSGGVSINPA